MQSQLKSYLAIRQAIANLGRDNSLDDDVLDTVVEMYLDEAHFTDLQLINGLKAYREYEQSNPEYVQRGDALRAQ